MLRNGQAYHIVVSWLAIYINQKLVNSGDKQTYKQFYTYLKKTAVCISKLPNLSLKVSKEMLLAAA